MPTHDSETVFIVTRLAARATIRGGKRRKVALDDQDQFPCQASPVARSSGTKYRSTGQNEIQSTMGWLLVCSRLILLHYPVLPAPRASRHKVRVWNCRPDYRRRCNLDGMGWDGGGPEMEGSRQVG